jgi:hypothetical protein
VRDEDLINEKLFAASLNGLCLRLRLFDTFTKRIESTECVHEWKEFGIDAMKHNDKVHCR